MPDENAAVTAESTESAEQEQTQEQQPEVKVDPYESRARELGWNPDYDGEDKIDAREFILRAPLFDKIKSQSKKLKEQEKALHDLASHIDKVSEASYKRAFADLQKEKRVAVEEADPEKVAAIDEQIEQLREDLAPKKQEAKSDLHPVVADWLEKKENQWFRADQELSAFAIAFQNSLFVKNPNMDMEDSLKEVTKAVKKAFPEKFTNPNRQAAPPVESASAAVTSPKTFGYRDLSDEQRRIADRFERQGIMKKEDYIKQLAENGLVGGR